MSKDRNGGRYKVAHDTCIIHKKGAGKKNEHGKANRVKKIQDKGGKLP